MKLLLILTTGFCVYIIHTSIFLIQKKKIILLLYPIEFFSGENRKYAGDANLTWSSRHKNTGNYYSTSKQLPFVVPEASMIVSNSGLISESQICERQILYTKSA